MSEKCPRCGTECKWEPCPHLLDDGQCGGEDAPCPGVLGTTPTCHHLVPLPDPEVKRLRAEIDRLNAALTYQRDAIQAAVDSENTAKADRDAAVKRAEEATARAEDLAAGLAEWQALLTTAESRVAALEGGLRQLLGEVAELGYDREDEERAYDDDEEVDRGEPPRVLIGTIPWEGIWKARALLATPEAQGEPSRKEEPDAAK